MKSNTNTLYPVSTKLKLWTITHSSGLWKWPVQMRWWVRRFEKVFSKGKEFQTNWYNSCSFVIKLILWIWHFSFTALQWALQWAAQRKSQGSQKSTTEWSKVDLNKWSVSFGGIFLLKKIFLLKSGFRFSIQPLKTLFFAQIPTYW